MTTATQEVVSATGFVFMLNSFFDLPYPRRDEVYHLFDNGEEYRKKEEMADEKHREAIKQWREAKGWSSFGPFNSEEEAIAYLDQLGFTKNRKQVEYSGFHLEEAWVWTYPGSPITWWLRKVTQSQLDQWIGTGDDCGWRLRPLSEIPEDRLYPAVVIARETLPRLEQEVTNMTENLRQEIEQRQRHIDSHQEKIKNLREVIRNHEQKKL